MNLEMRQLPWPIFGETLNLFGMPTQGIPSLGCRKGRKMSSEADVFIARNFQAGGATVEWTFNAALVTDSFWSASAVPQGTNTNVELVRQFTVSDAGGVRRLHFVVVNRTGLDTFWTRGVVRIPNV
ncbi:hypothetical protein [Streptomyces syringium]|uniref:hypothetical protein n=1 Tax=Streptomyces syringium TaxID=76729 RepID=UPI003423D35E